MSGKHAFQSVLGRIFFGLLNYGLRLKYSFKNVVFLKINLNKAVKLSFFYPLLCLYDNVFFITLYMVSIRHVPKNFIDILAGHALELDFFFALILTLHMVEIRRLEDLLIKI